MTSLSFSIAPFATLADRVTEDDANRPASILRRWCAAGYVELAATGDRALRVRPPLTDPGPIQPLLTSPLCTGDGVAPSLGRWAESGLASQSAPSRPEFTPGLPEIGNGQRQEHEADGIANVVARCSGSLGDRLGHRISHLGSPPL